MLVYICFKLALAVHMQPIIRIQCVPQIGLIRGELAAPNVPQLSHILVVDIAQYKVFIGTLCWLSVFIPTRKGAYLPLFSQRRNLPPVVVVFGCRLFSFSTSQILSGVAGFAWLAGRGNTKNGLAQYHRSLWHPSAPWSSAKFCYVVI